MALIKCIHASKDPDIPSMKVTNKDSGQVYRFCMDCFYVFNNDKRNNVTESRGYYLYKSLDPSIPKKQWTKVNEKPIFAMPDGVVQFNVGKPKEGASYYITVINALGLESYPGEVVYIPGVDAPKFVLKSVLLFGETTDEGKLVEAVTLPWFEIIETIRKDPSAAFQISDRTWEEIIAGIYHRAGFGEVTLTPRSGDFGRDVIAVKKGVGTIRVIDQVKAYKPDHLVDANDVRALIGVLHGDHAAKAFLTTTSDFAPRIPKDPLISQYIPSRLELVNGEKLFKRLLELGMKK